MTAVAEYLRFRLDPAFVASYARRPVPWGFDIGGGNSLGELVFLTRYSRIDGGGKERWHETVARVVEGTFSILEDHCRCGGLPWDRGAQEARAREMYDRMFDFRWLPPGRGLWMMGTPFVAEHGSAALQNCAFVSTRSLRHGEDVQPFVLLMEMSMLGIGVGFDTRGRDRLDVRQPQAHVPHEVDDSRDGWCRSLELLLAAYLRPRQPLPVFDYRRIRPAGAPLRSFGGISGGPEPLVRLHAALSSLLSARVGGRLGSTDVVDIMNLIGKCVAAGNIRRAAEIAIGSADDERFLDLKDPTRNPERMGPDGWGHLSNNSVVVGPDTDLTAVVERIRANGEPGLFFQEIARSSGRLCDPPNHRDAAALGTNPCAEQTLEDRECCTLVETFPSRHRTKRDYLRTLEAALTYAKAVTLLPTHWPDVNEVMARNRRIGCSMSGIAEFADDRGWPELLTWCDEGYRFLRATDRRLSRWLRVPESIKLTSVKPSGTVSLLAGVTPGVHFPEGGRTGPTLRRVRLDAGAAAVTVLAEAGYPTEPDEMDPRAAAVVEVPVGPLAVRPATVVGMWEKAALASLLQRHWADNQVSVTVTFGEDELEQILPLLHAFAGQFKSLSFLPRVTGGAYGQMPYEPLSDAEHRRRTRAVRRRALDELYSLGAAPAGESYCTNEGCA